MPSCGSSGAVSASTGPARRGHLDSGSRWTVSSRCLADGLISHHASRPIPPVRHTRNLASGRLPLDPTPRLPQWIRRTNCQKFLHLSPAHRVITKSDEVLAKDRRTRRAPRIRSSRCCPYVPLVGPARVTPHVHALGRHALDRCDLQQEVRRRPSPPPSSAASSVTRGRLRVPRTTSSASVVGCAVSWPLAPSSICRAIV